jgi:hypothetical protein
MVYMLYGHILQAFLWLVNKKNSEGGAVFGFWGGWGVCGVELGLGVVRAC